MHARDRAGARRGGIPSRRRSGRAGAVR
jgi:hypothetical protein